MKLKIALGAIQRLASKPTTGGRTSSCALYASGEMVCPLCRAKIPAYTMHTCEKKT